MTQSLNPNYSAENSKSTVERAFYIEFEDIDIVFSNKTLLNVPVEKTVKTYIQELPLVGGERIDLLDNKNTINDATFTLNNINGEITKFIAEYPVIAKQVTIKNGFTNIDYDDFETIFSGRLVYFKYRKNDLSFDFQITDRQRKLKQPIFVNKSIYMKQNGLLVDDYDLNLSNISYGSKIFSSSIKSLPFIDESESDFFYIVPENSLQEEYENTIMKFTSGLNEGLNFLVSETDLQENRLKVFKNQFSSTQLSNILIGDDFGIYFNSEVQLLEFINDVGFDFFYLTPKISLNEDYSNTLVNFTSGLNSGKYFFVSETDIENNRLKIFKDEFTPTELSNVSVGDDFDLVNIESLKINGNIVDFLLFILDNELNLISETKSIAESLSSYDYIDSTFETIRNEQLSLYDFQYFIEEDEQNGYDFLTSEILKITQTYLIPNNNGYIFLSIIKQPTFETNLKTFDDNPNELGNLVDISDEDFQPDKIINQIIFNFDFNESSEKYDNTRYYIQSDSINKYSLQPALKIESKLLKSSFNAVQIIERIVNRIFSRYQNPEPIIPFITDLSYIDVELNDLIKLSSNNLEDIVNGNSFIKDAIMQIVNKKVDFANNQITFTVFDTQYQGIATVWNENISTDYKDSTEDQKAFKAYYSDADGNVEESPGNFIPANGYADI